MFIDVRKEGAGQKQGIVKKVTWNKEERLVARKVYRSTDSPTERSMTSHEAVEYYRSMVSQQPSSRFQETRRNDLQMERAILRKMRTQQPIRRRSQRPTLSSAQLLRKDLIALQVGDDALFEQTNTSSSPDVDQYPCLEANESSANCKVQAALSHDVVSVVPSSSVSSMTDVKTKTNSADLNATSEMPASMANTSKDAMVDIEANQLAAIHTQAQAEESSGIPVSDVASTVKGGTMNESQNGNTATVISLLRSLTQLLPKMPKPYFTRPCKWFYSPTGCAKGSACHFFHGYPCVTPILNGGPLSQGGQTASMWCPVVIPYVDFVPSPPTGSPSPSHESASQPVQCLPPKTIEVSTGQSQSTTRSPCSDGPT